MRELTRVTTECGGVSRTKQAFKDETDIAKIVARHGGIPAAQHPGRFIDATVVNDFFAAQVMLSRAEQAFAMLPARVRDRFENDPAALVRTVEAALGDVEGHKDLVEELVALDLLDDGLLARFGVPAEPGDSAVPGVPPAPAEPAPAGS